MYKVGRKLVKAMFDITYISLTLFGIKPSNIKNESV